MTSLSSTGTVVAMKCIHGISFCVHCPECYSISYTQRVVDSYTTNGTAPPAPKGDSRNDDSQG